MLRPWFEPLFEGNERARLAAVVDSGYVNDGPVTREFERRVAEIHGYKYGVAVTSGTAAIALALMAIDVRGGEVIVPDLTFIATANAVRLAGGAVRLKDVSIYTGCLREEFSVGFASAIVAVEVNGSRPDYNKLGKYNLPIIVDGCQSFGSQRVGRQCVAYCLSFSPNKLITTGQGGMVLTDEPWVYEALVELKDQGRRRRGTGGGEDEHLVLGYNFKFTDIQAAIGLAQLDQLDKRIEIVKHRNAAYTANLAGILGWIRGSEGLQLWYEAISPLRNEIASALKAGGYDSRKFWKPLHTQGPYRKSTFPDANWLSNRGLWLPSAFSLTEKEIEEICSIVRATCQTILA